MKHRLKTVQPYFDEVKSGKKLFELRKNDRNFKVKDILILCEWTGKDYTGEEIYTSIKYILSDFEGLEPGYCILGIN